jgi:hypothetical protein
VAAYISRSLLVYVCMVHRSAVGVYCRTVQHTNNALPDESVTAPKHVGAVLM